MRTAGAGAGAGVAGGGVGAATGTLIRTTGAAGSGAAVGGEMLIRGGAEGGAGAGTALGAMAGGGAICGAVGGAAGVVETDNATGPVMFPNCRRTSSLMRADKSTPQSGQANVTGWRTISGEASKAYFAPQSHWIFIWDQGLGFNSTTFVPSGSAMVDVAGDDFMPPSQNKNVPPYL